GPQTKGVRVLADNVALVGAPADLIDCTGPILTDTAAQSGQTAMACGASSGPATPACQNDVGKNDQCASCDPHAIPRPGGGPPAHRQGRVTGDGTSSTQFGVNGTDLGIPYAMGDGSVGYLFGDSFSTPGVGGPNWRSPVLLRSNSKVGDDIVFGGSAGQVV